jgi:hypothetical protein
MYCRLSAKMIQRRFARCAMVARARMCSTAASTAIGQALPRGSNDVHALKPKVICSG